MGCEDVQAHLADHLARALPAATAAQVDAHLRTCPSCAAEFQAAEDTWQRLGVIPGAAPPDSAAMRARFHAMLDEHHGRPNDPPVRWRVPAAPWLLQGAAAAAMVVLGVAIGRQTAAPAAADAQITDMRAELREMREMVTLSLLQQPSASERLKGITWTSQLERPGMDVTAALLDTLRHDPNIAVRIATIDALKRFAEFDAVRRGAIEALPRETSPLVQMALIDFVVEVNGRDAADTLRQLSRDPMQDEAVRARAARGLERVG
jgi:hypothetical protein